MLELKHICYTAEDNEILEDVNLAIDDRFVAVTGPNGSGKSTLAKLIMGIKTPTAGQILLDGEDITHLSITERAKRGISFAFQKPVEFKGLRVKDLLALADRNSDSLQRSCDILSSVGLCARDYIDRELNGTLSGGEMKRIEIAMTVARGAKVSIFDEPEAGIDLWSFQSLISVFQRLYESTSGTIIIISHQERILDIADKIVYLKDGHVERYDQGKAVLQQLSGSLGPATCSVLADQMDGSLASREEGSAVQ